MSPACTSTVICALALSMPLATALTGLNKPVDAIATTVGADGTIQPISNRSEGSASFVDGGLVHAAIAADGKFQVGLGDPTGQHVIFGGAKTATRSLEKPVKRKGKKKGAIKKKTKGKITTSGRSPEDKKDDKDDDEEVFEEALDRPGSVKSEACDGLTCFGCTEKKKCWSGKEEVRRKRKTDKGKEAVRTIEAAGALELVLAKRELDSYVAEVYASCPIGTNGEWSVHVENLQGGNLVIYTDLGESGHMKKYAEVPSSRRRADIKVNVGNKKTRIRVAFYPTIATNMSAAEIQIKATDVNPALDQCMTSKLCLRLLGDGTVASFKLRNLNWLQLQCLEGKKLSGGMQEKCRQWDDCMSEGRESNKMALVALLRAGLLKGRVGKGRGGKGKVGKGESLGEKKGAEEKNGNKKKTEEKKDAVKFIEKKTTEKEDGEKKDGEKKDDAKKTTKNKNEEKRDDKKKDHEKTKIEKKDGEKKDGPSLTQAAAVANGTAAAATDPNECVNPSADDAESWDCECLKDMVSDCKGSDSLEECLRARMCESDVVCDHWKQDHCPDKDKDESETMIQYKDKGASAKLSQRLMLRSEAGENSAAQGRTEDILQDSLKGKCTSETRL